MVEFDRMVGKVAGAIYSDIIQQFPQPPLMLVPALTFKVRKILEPITDLSFFSDEQKAKLAKDIQISIIPMLFSYEIEPSIIESITPTIEVAALNALREAA
ncbi:MAG: hypothetical protein KCHDKBKB_01377 [Elusimicrobia bacterium]|nr:hypothetical protein [Elusimicrobiota bacterium]